MGTSPLDEGTVVLVSMSHGSLLVLLSILRLLLLLLVYAGENHLHSCRSFPMLSRG